MDSRPTEFFSVFQMLGKARLRRPGLFFLQTKTVQDS
jgi:hypothetical protein